MEMNGKATLTLRCGVPDTINSLMKQKARYTYHAKLNMMHHWHNIICLFLFLNSNMAAMAMGTVISRNTNKSTFPYIMFPSPSFKKRLYNTELTPIPFGSIDKSGRHRHSIVKTNAHNKKTVCLRCHIFKIQDCPSMGRGNKHYHL